MEQNVLRRKCVGVVGLSVGGEAAVTLAQEHLCGHLKIADFDRLELSNLNRLGAGMDDLGTPKAWIAARRIAEECDDLAVKYDIRVRVAGLAVTELVSWGALVYAFSVLVVPMRAELGWSTAQLNGAYTTGVAVSGLVAIPLGRRLARHGARGVTTAGSLLGVAALLAWAHVQSLVTFYATFVLAWLAMAAGPGHDSTARRTAAAPAFRLGNTP